MLLGDPRMERLKYHEDVMGAGARMSAGMWCVVGVSDEVP